MKKSIKARTIVIVVLILIAIAPLMQILFKTFAANNPSSSSGLCMVASPSATAGFNATTTAGFNATATVTAMATPITCLPPSSATTTITVSNATIGKQIPVDFTGLSYEASTLTGSAFETGGSGNLSQLLKTLGQGNIRIGGNTVDRGFFWQAPGQSVPSWAQTVIGPNNLNPLAGLTQATKWPVELAVDLGNLHTASQTTADPVELTAIKNEAQTAASKLGLQLKAIECGNEPNDFKGKSRPSTYNYAQYKADFEACANDIGSIAKIAGPDTVGPYITQFVTDEHSHINMVTQHAYTINKCGNSSASKDLLAAQSDTSELAKVKTELAAATAQNLPLRLDETNSANCGGMAGVSDTYASSLWAADYMLLMAQDGVAGVNFHGSLGLCESATGNGNEGNYTPLCATSTANLNKHIYTPQPVFYGMLFFSQINGGGGTFLKTQITTTNNITAYTIKGKDNKMHVVVIDKDDPAGKPVTITLKTGARPTAEAKASMLTLAGESLTGSQNITLQGTKVQANGTFQPGAAKEFAQNNDGTYTIQIKAGTANLVTF